jgi:hypothetical protein
VVVHEAHELERRKALRRHLLIELPGPFGVAIEVGQLVVESAEEGVRQGEESGLRWKCDLGIRACRIA